MENNEGNTGVTNEGLILKSLRKSNRLETENAALIAALKEKDAKLKELQLAFNIMENPGSRMRPEEGSTGAIQSTWIKVNDRFPNETALLATKSKMVVIGDYYDGQWRVNGHWSHNGSTWISEYKFDDITHWMPLPELPNNNSLTKL